jgi:hypothetical protein
MVHKHWAVCVFVVSVFMGGGYFFIVERFVED